MFEGNTFLGETGMPIEKIVRAMIRLEDWLPDPLMVAAWNVKSFTTGLVGAVACSSCASNRPLEVVVDS